MWGTGRERREGTCSCPVLFSLSFLRLGSWLTAPRILSLKVIWGSRTDRREGRLKDSI